MMSTSRRPWTDAVLVDTEKYPPLLVAAILRALRQSMRAAGCGEAQGLLGKDRQLTNRSDGGWTDSGGAGAAVTP